MKAIADLLECSEAVDELFGRGAAQGDNGIAGRVRFTDVVLDKAKKQLLVYALRDLGLGLYNLGRGGAVGRGYIKVSRIAIACGDKTADMTFGVDGCKLNDTDNLVSAWLHALEERT